jgi:hypothetical protein
MFHCGSKSSLTNAAALWESLLSLVRANDVQLNVIAPNQLSLAQLYELCESLHSNTRVHTLRLCRVLDGDAEQAPALAKLLLRNTSLTSLHVNMCWLGDEGAQVLAIGIANHPSLQELDVAFNQIQEKGFTTLCRALHQCHSLRWLDISGNPQVLGALSELVILLQRCPLRTLIVGDCWLPAESLRLLLHALEGHALEHLGLHHNELGEPEQNMLATFLRKRQCALIQLNLANCGLGTSPALIAALKVSTSLRQVDLSGNALGEKGGQLLAAALKVNLTLTHLQLAETELTRVAVTLTGSKCSISIADCDRRSIHSSLQRNLLRVQGTKPESRQPTHPLSHPISVVLGLWVLFGLPVAYIFLRFPIWLVLLAVSVWMCLIDPTAREGRDAAAVMLLMQQAKLALLEPVQYPSLGQLEMNSAALSHLRTDVEAWYAELSTIQDTKRRATLRERRSAELAQRIDQGRAMAAEVDCQKARQALKGMRAAFRKAYPHHFQEGSPQKLALCAAETASQQRQIQLETEIFEQWARVAELHALLWADDFRSPGLRLVVRVLGLIFWLFLGVLGFVWTMLTWLPTVSCILDGFSDYVLPALSHFSIFLPEPIRRETDLVPSLPG